MSTWQDRARRCIEDAHAEIPADASFAERKKAIQAAFEGFGWHARTGWPYKAWLKAQRHYLNSFDETGRRGRQAKPTGLEHLPRDPATGRPVIR